MPYRPKISQLPATNHGINDSKIPSMYRDKEFLGSFFKRPLRASTWAASRCNLVESPKEKVDRMFPQDENTHYSYGHDRMG